MTVSCKWIGISGNIYNFKVFRIGTSFKVLPGVYIFCKLDSDGYWRALYIGQTKDLSERFDNHHKMPDIKRLGATHLHVCVNKNGKRAREAQESDLIANYKPPLNERS